MKCYRCGYKLNPKGSKWCGVCGTKLVSLSSIKRLCKIRFQRTRQKLFSLGTMLFLVVKILAFVVAPSIFLTLFGVAVYNDTSKEKTDYSTAAFCTMVDVSKEYRTATIEQDRSIWKVYYHLWDPRTKQSKSELIVRRSKKQAEEDVKTWVNSGYLKVN